MSQENVEIIKQCLAAYQAHGFEAMRRFCDPSMEMAGMVETAQFPTRGFDAAVDTMRNWQSAFGDFHAELNELIDAGDHVIVALQERGIPRGGGAEIRQTLYMVHTLCDGKITRLAWFPGRQEAFRAAGLSE